MISIDDFYPVGSIYETSDVNFNPSDSFGGTWSQISDDSVLLSESEEHVVGESGGANEVQLTINQIPSHRHSANIGNLIGSSKTSWGNTVFVADWGKIATTTSNSVPYGPSTVTFPSKGGNQAHNNMQPYIYVKRWKREA